MSLHPRLLPTVLFVLLTGPLCLPSVAETEAPDTTAPAALSGKTLGNVLLDAEHRTLVVTGWVNLVEGPIEFLACGRTGKTHESIFILDVEATQLHAAFLLMGLQPGTPPTELGEGRPEGPACRIWVEWEAEGEPRRLRAERFIFNHETRERLPDTGWVFTGSQVRNGMYMASSHESHVATYWDPWAVINIPLPCGANDEILFVHEEVIPELGTPVRMVFELDGLPTHGP